jgi:hypothetical protein
VGARADTADGRLTRVESPNDTATWPPQGMCMRCGMARIVQEGNLQECERHTSGQDTEDVTRLNVIATTGS